MSKTIAINAGSSSLKWQLYAMPQEQVIAKGLIERIGLNDAMSTVHYQGEKTSETLPIKNHKMAVKALLNDLISFHIIQSYDEITGIGHRVVAGGEEFTESVLVDDDVLSKIEALSLLAPLHNPANIEGIRAFKEILPEVDSVAVFDTAFHTTMPEKAYRYPIPHQYYKEHHIRKYGAHGTSHFYVAHEAATLLKKPIQELKLITIHAGNGVSITAIDKGKSVDTSMGFTPLGGVMMGTRSGDLDPAILPYLMMHTDLKTPQDIDSMLNRQSGLLGISLQTNDMRDITEKMEQGDENCRLAYEMFIDRIVKFVGQYLAILKGADAIVFTAGIGENSATIRKDIISHFHWAGADISPDKQTINQTKGVISSPHASIKVLVVPTDEELVIARDVERLKHHAPLSNHKKEKI